eukprot:gb/GECH01012359.1/.p1 GENE.gb/GECH01012359.1/~~gb/GECH01012359.1/.p1  ORF type:complete len:273 (+),score=98.71 gb/GECH01012359.1/:1-819(+)
MSNPPPQEESIYNLLEKPPEEERKPFQYKSQFPPDTPPTGSTLGLKNTTVPGVGNIGGNQRKKDELGTHKTKRSNATMGKEHSKSIKPDSYLKKTNDKYSGSKSKTFQYPESQRKPPVPKRNEKPIMGLNSKKNFISTNALDTILSVPRKKKEEEFKWTQKQDYGKVPQYLKNIQEEIQDEKDFIHKMQETQVNEEKNRVKQLEENERQQLLDKLRSRHAKLLERYTRLSFIQSKLPRQEAAENETLKELQELEKDIERLSKDVVFVYEDEM